MTFFTQSDGSMFIIAMKVPHFCHPRMRGVNGAYDGSMFIIAMKVPHFCHPETNRIGLTHEGSVFRDNTFIHCGVGNTYKF